MPSKLICYGWENWLRGQDLNRPAKRLKYANLIWGG